MSKETNKLIPELRFPEFVNEGEWEVMELGKLCDYLNGASHENGVSEIGEFYLISLNSIDIEGNLKSEMKKLSYTDNSLQKNDLIMVLSDVAHGNFLGLTDIIPNDKYVLNQRMAGLRIKDIKQANSYFLRAYINKNQKYFKTKGQGSSQLNLSKSSVTEFPVIIPKNPNEQQKIATCLSSLDEVIAGLRQNLTALKTHKKGLMQNLFPQEGKTIPKWRFSEFVNDGEWANLTLSEICKITSGGTPNRSNSEFWNGDIPWISTTLINFNTINQANEYITEVGLQNSSAKIFSKSTILMAMYGQGKTRGKVAILGIEAATNQACAAILLKEGYITDYVFQYLAAHYDDIRELSNRGGQENLSGGLIEIIPISIPKPKEQQKIATCLSSLDDLITTQAEKIEQLKLHKKGLMQQLFPNVEMEQEYNQRSAATVNSGFQLIEI